MEVEKMGNNGIRKWDPASSDRAGLCRGQRCGMRKERADDRGWRQNMEDERVGRWEDGPAAVGGLRQKIK